MKLSAFKFNLPKELLAEHPAKNRDESRLMVVDRKTGKIIGRPFTNATAKEIRIITQGNSSRNFEVLSASSPTGKATTDLVIIHEWEKNYEKTFTALSNDTAYSGICI